MPCGQKGRVDQLWTSRTGPIAPAWIHSAICGAVCWPAAQNMWVAAPVSRAVRTTSLRLAEDGGERLVGDDVLPGPHRRDGDRRVQVVGRHDVDGVEVLLLRQHLPEVGVGGDARAGRGAVVAVDDLAAHLAPARAGPRALRPGGVLQEGPHLVPQLEAGPLDVVLAPPVGVADRGDAEVGPLQGRHELPEALRAAADEAHVDAVARRHVPRSPEDRGVTTRVTAAVVALFSRKVRRLTEPGFGMGGLLAGGS